jgi:urease accessory protein
MTDASLYALLTWLSPAMPVGAFSYSHGLEAAVEAGLVHDPVTLGSYLETALTDGAGQLDASFVRSAYEAVDDEALLGEVLMTAAIMRGTAELALESRAQGEALLRVLRTAWPHPALERLARLSQPADIQPAHAVVLGVAAAAHRVPLADTLIAFLHAFAANLISAGLRLIPLGQSDGQRLTAAIQPVVSRVAAGVLRGDPRDLGTAAPIIDWLSMTHETQYTRLFRS